jgi:dienelactone hydrolase
MLFLFACTSQTPSDTASQAQPEPLVLPADPAENGVPAGVATVDANGQEAEVWYPASDSFIGVPTDSADFGQFVPQSVLDLLGSITFPEIDGMAVRDATPRVAEGKGYPVVLFSHGLGAMRIQSVDYAAHLASRGYVVVAVDHPGRRFADLIPCVFSPALEGCDLTGFAGVDPAVDDVTALADWVESGGLDSFYADSSRIAMSGHSAGGGTTITVGTDDNRIDASLVLSAPGLPDMSPALVIGGACDAIIPIDEILGTGETGEVIVINGAGHLAFSDMCELGLLEIGETLLAPREDVSQGLLNSFLDLASDGCPERPPDPNACANAEYLPLATSDTMIRHYSTVFFDSALYGTGPGVEAGLFTEVEIP